MSQDEFYPPNSPKTFADASIAGVTDSENKDHELSHTVMMRITALDRSLSSARHETIDQILIRAKQIFDWLNTGEIPETTKAQK